MNRLKQLINELCPEGVEYKTLEKVAKISNGKDHKHLGEGEIPVYGSGGIMRYADKYISDKTSVLIPRKGSIGNIFYVDTPFWTVDTIFYTKINFEIINPKFLYHYLLTQDIAKLNTAGGVPSLTKKVLDKIAIPLPPLPVQEEIVRILDNFKELTADITTELTAELTAREKQYEYYRDSLFTFGDVVEWKTLNQISENLNSKRKPVTKSNRETGNYPYYGASGVVDYVSDYIFDGDFLLISEDGANLLSRTMPIAFSACGKIWVNNHAHIIKFDDYASRRFVEIYLNSIDLNKFISTAAQPKLTKENLNKIPIPYPDPIVRKKIVEILDRFDALCNNIIEALSAEIKVRQQQYEHYREKLLTFKVKEGCLNE